MRAVVILILFLMSRGGALAYSAAPTEASLNTSAAQTPATLIYPYVEYVNFAEGWEVLPADQKPVVTGVVERERVIIDDTIYIQCEITFALVAMERGESIIIDEHGVPVEMEFNGRLRDIVEILDDVAVDGCYFSTDE